MKVHIALATHDLEKSIEFYRLFLDQEPVKIKPGYAKFDVDEPGLNLALNEVDGDEATAVSGPTHFGIQVESTTIVADTTRRLAAAGLETEVENDVDCCTALQDKVWVRDPDGNRWEVFFVKVADTLPGVGTSAATQTGCCS